jgi:thymidine kinase
MAKLTFIFSSMNSGKTLALLTKNFMLREKGYRTLLIKPAMDDRTTTISSRIGLEAECMLINTTDMVSEIIKKNYDYLLVDEAQFLTKEQVIDLASIVDNDGISVICYGLKNNWKGELFEGSNYLLVHSDEIIMMESVCKYYKESNSAMYHIKINGDNSEIETGYEDMYESVSRRKWFEWFNSRKIT